MKSISELAQYELIQYTVNYSTVKKKSASSAKSHYGILVMTDLPYWSSF